MKITIIGGGNMGTAIALGLSSSEIFSPNNITVIDTNPNNIASLNKVNSSICAVLKNYDSLVNSDLVLLAVKPWLVEEVLTTHKQKLNKQQIIISIAAGVSLEQLSQWTPINTAIFRIMPNTAISIQQSMSFVASLHASNEQNALILNIFNSLGKAELIDEKLFPAATSLASCGIAYAFRYIRAAMEGGIEMGFYPNQAKDIVLQTLRGAIDLLEANQSHPEAEIDKVTTAGGVTIRGLNEMEHAGFTPAVIKGLKVSYKIC